MYSLDDTIAAISTPLGEGGIGIVRLSGPRAGPIAESLFRPHHAGQKPQSYRLCYGHILDPTDATVVDEVLVSFMGAPHSYTRQDVAEINCHGGIVPLRRVLQLVLASGARLAEPGELTLRAFLNGRLHRRGHAHRRLALSGRRGPGRAGDPFAVAADPVRP